MAKDLSSRERLSVAIMRLTALLIAFFMAYWGYATYQDLTAVPPATETNSSVYIWVDHHIVPIQASVSYTENEIFPSPVPERLKELASNNTVNIHLKIEPILMTQGITLYIVLNGGIWSSTDTKSDAECPFSSYFSSGTWECEHIEEAGTRDNNLDLNTALESDSKYVIKSFIAGDSLKDGESITLFLKTRQSWTQRGAKRFTFALPGVGTVASSSQAYTLGSATVYGPEPTYMQWSYARASEIVGDHISYIAGLKADERSDYISPAPDTERSTHWQGRTNYAAPRASITNMSVEENQGRQTFWLGILMGFFPGFLTFSIGKLPYMILGVANRTFPAMRRSVSTATYYWILLSSKIASTVSKK